MDLVMLQWATESQGGLLLKLACSVVASCSLQCWPSIRGCRRPTPENTLQAVCPTQSAFTIHFLPLTDCPCTSHWGFLHLQTQTNDMSYTALGCQQNYWRQISGLQWGCRKSIICQHLARVFWVVKHCTQTNKCPLMGYRGGTELKAWFGMENKGFLQLTTSLFKMLPDWTGMWDNMNSHGQEWSIIISIL